MYKAIQFVEADEQVLSTIFQAPADTSIINQAHVFTTTKPIKDCSDDFLCFTYQVPRTENCTGWYI